MKEEYLKSYKFFRATLGNLFMLWYNPKVIGKENIPESGSILVCGNHINVYDQCPVIMSTKRMIHYMAKKEYFDSKFAWFFRKCGCISVNRSIKDIEAKDHAIELLNKGYAVGLFPEGTRNKKRDEMKLLPFKFGAVSMAQKTNSLIVPFGINGEYKFRSKNLVIKIGKPIDVTGMTYEEANDLLKDTISSLIDD